MIDLQTYSLSVGEKRKKLFAYIHDQHKDQLRKGGEPYIYHVIRVADSADNFYPNDLGWEIGLCHDLFEDQMKDFPTIPDKITEFTRVLEKDCRYTSKQSHEIVKGVVDLTDVYTSESYPKMGRAKRKISESYRLASTSEKIQTIKYIDLMDNTSSIVEIDSSFAPSYLEEKFDLLNLMDKGDANLRLMCYKAICRGMFKLYKEYGEAVKEARKILVDDESRAAFIREIKYYGKRHNENERKTSP